MLLTSKQLNLIELIDKKVKEIVARGGSEQEILVAFVDDMLTIRTIIDSFKEGRTEEEQKYFNQYSGFYQYIKILETLSIDINNAKGKV